MCIRDRCAYVANLSSDRPPQGVPDLKDRHVGDGGSRVGGPLFTNLCWLVPRPCAADRPPGRYPHAAGEPVAWLTGAVGAGTLAVSVAALASPTLMLIMTRNLAQLRAGQWWRIITPVLVQPDGWGQLVFNLLGVTVVGAALEHRTSRAAWILTYLSLIHISEPTRLLSISYAVFCLNKHKHQ